MSDVTLVGRNILVEQPAKQGWSRDRGYYALRSWRGPKNLIPGKAAELRANGFPYEITHGYRKSTISATIGNDAKSESIEVPVSIWERSVSRVEKTIYQSNRLTSQLGDSDIETLRQNVQEKEFAIEEYDNPEDAYAWFYLIMAGVDSFILEQPNLVWTRTVSNNFDVAQLASFLAKTNVGKIIRFADMINQEGAPSYLVDDLSDENPFFSIAGYRKASPTISQQAEGKIQIVNQYEYGFWAGDLYDFATY